MTKVNDQHVYVAMPVAEAGNNPFNFSLASVMLAVLSDGRNIIVDKEKCPFATYLCAKIHKYFLLAKNIACFLTEGGPKRYFGLPDRRNFISAPALLLHS